MTAPPPANKSNSSAEEKKQEPKPEPAVAEPNQTEKAVPEAAEEPSESPVQEEEGNDDDFQFSETMLGLRRWWPSSWASFVAREERRGGAATEIEEDPRTLMRASRGGKKRGGNGENRRGGNGEGQSNDDSSIRPCPCPS